MIPSIPGLADYDVSAIHGFLPSDPPCESLSDPYFRPWESIICNLQGLILTKRLRSLVDRLPVLDAGLLRSKAEWRRAYSILGFIVHSYVWGADTPSDRIPPSISIPFLQTCRHLELPPVATYAGLVLWNWKPLLVEEPIDNLENIFTLHTFTGSLDESWFYLVSVAIEAAGARTIPVMLQAVASARAKDAEMVTECLRTFAEQLDQLGSLLTRMYENCDPHVFYHKIRPFLAGSMNMADAGLPRGIVFDTGSGNDHYVQFSGGSNAQSSIIQFFDIMLGIEHRPFGERSEASSASESEGGGKAKARPNFIQEMRRYMPGPHRRFLEQVERVANIRDFVTEHQHDRALSTAYDACLAMMRTFRDKHIQMVSRYIIVKSRESRSMSRSLSPNEAAATRRKINLAVGSRQRQQQHQHHHHQHNNQSPSPGGDIWAGGSKRLRGTGGTALIPFLKQARDETGEPAIDAWARRLLHNGPGAAEAENTFASESKAQQQMTPLASGARLTQTSEDASGEVEIVGLGGVWSVDDSEGGICHW